MKAINADEFAAVAKQFHVMCGLVLPEGKQYLVTQRLGPLLEGSGITSWQEYVALLAKDPHSSLAVGSIHAITTHETSWFRDANVFEGIEETVLPELAERIRERRERSSARRGAQITIWCAAVSTGQEAYSLAMLIDRFVQNNPDLLLEQFLILGTDISAPVLAQGMQGVYDDFEVGRGLRADLRDEYFEAVSGNRWRVRDRIRAIIQFQVASLIDPFAHVGGFDLVLCRNVLIYFDAETRARIVQLCGAKLSPGGIFMLGASECLMPVPDPFTVQRTPKAAFYRRA
ncbi:MAG: protein-glutamate O-methyltransferase CheR [Planctomycetota bacterium]|jgi:chemotaxis protein methyltransferase CheR|nr:protein-glutamate O-methyltransferase CheR [Planctomycetota bacterium]